ncbi:MAG: hypothetical protein Q8L20_08260 [Gammaproteobacteria bacterium]|nr:hypothetical protein [Gammaproteobacteria bacterium]MDP2347538.1 hypothetical protein [Gammaproteobacteria bacterium]
MNTLNLIITTRMQSRVKAIALTGGHLPCISVVKTPEVCLE